MAPDDERAVGTEAGHLLGRSDDVERAAGLALAHDVGVQARAAESLVVGGNDDPALFEQGSYESEGVVVGESERGGAQSSARPVVPWVIDSTGRESSVLPAGAMITPVTSIGFPFTASER